MNLGGPWAKIKRGAAEIISEAELEKKLASGKPLQVKLGMDPTAPDLHLGHLVALRKLRTFQDLGHTVAFILGDFTARIGDPSGQNQLRPRLSEDEIEKNSKTYLDQVFRVLDKKRTEVRRNSEWLLRLKSPTELAALYHRLFERASVQRLIERDEFTRRLRAEKAVFLSELIYPLFQGYDSVAVQADVEIGGTDQLFNLLMGREIQRDFRQELQVVLTLPLLEGLDGTRKMSKSYGNFVAFNDPPDQMFGKLMSVPDALFPKYAELLTELDLSKLKAMHPREAKALLARTLTAQFYGDLAAAHAEAEFDRVFSKKEVPAELETHRPSKNLIPLAELLVEAGLSPSKKESRRLLAQGAVEIDGKRVSDDGPLHIDKPMVIRVGKRRFKKIVPSQ